MPSLNEKDFRNTQGAANTSQNDDIIKVTSNVEFNSKIIVTLAGAIITGVGTILFNQYNNSSDIKQQIAEDTSKAAAVCTIGSLPINIADPELKSIQVKLVNRDGSTQQYNVTPKPSSSSTKTLDITSPEGIQ